MGKKKEAQVSKTKTEPNMVKKEGNKTGKILKQG